MNWGSSGARGQTDTFEDWVTQCVLPKIFQKKSSSEARKVDESQLGTGEEDMSSGYPGKDAVRTSSIPYALHNTHENTV